MDSPPAPSAEHLRLLSIFHYVFAGLAVLGLVFLGLHYLLVDTILQQAEHRPNAPPELFLDLFAWVYAFLAGVLVLGGVLNLMVARALVARRRWLLCAVVAAINCLQMPLGTILGVFTLVVINRDEVRASFR